MASFGSQASDHGSIESEQDHDIVVADERKQEISKSRMKMVVLDLLLTYPTYSFSLFFFLASLCSPPFENLQMAIQTPFQQLQIFVDQEAGAYRECVADTFALLDEKLVETANRERDNVVERQAFNLKFLQEMETTTHECSLATLKAQQGLHQWHNILNQNLPLFNISSEATNCSNEDMAFVLKSIRQENRDVENDVMKQVGDYRRQSEWSFSLARDYAKERSNYDYNYFLRNRIEPAVDLLKELSNQTVSMELSYDARLAVDELLVLAEAFKTTILKARQRFEQAMDHLREFYDIIERLYEYYQNLHFRAMQMINVSAAWFVEGGLLYGYDLDGIELFQVDGILQLDPFYVLPDNFALPDIEAEFVDVDLMLDDFAKEAARVIQKVVQVLMKEAATVLRDTTKDLMQLILEQLALEDYNPPQFRGSKPQVVSLEQETTLLLEVGDDVEKKTKQSLVGLDLLGKSGSSEIKSDIPEVEDTDHSFSGNTTTFNYRELPLAGFLELLVRVLKWLASSLSRLWCIEAGYNVYRVWKRKRKYENDATPEIPDVSYGTIESRLHDDETGSKRWTRKLFRLLDFLLDGRFLGGLILLLLLLSAFAVYKVWYPHVQERCMLSKNGTNFANNFAAPFMINRASTPGNLLYTEKEAACREHQRLLCDSMLVESEVAYRNSLASLSNFQDKHSKSISMASRLERCIDIDVLDMSFREACCGLEGYSSGCQVEPRLRTHQCPIDYKVDPAASFQPIGSYLIEDGCLTKPTDWDLRDSRFNCRALEDICVTTTSCNGVDEELVHSMVVEADCLAQIGVIRFCYVIGIAVCQFGMIKWFCSKIFEGIKHLHWEDLNPHGMRFSTQMDKDGNLLMGKAAYVRAEEASVVMEEFRNSGRTTLKLGLASAMVWIISFWLFPSVDLDYFA